MFVADVANTASSTINFNTLGAKTIKKLDSGSKINIVANDIGVGMRVFLVYDGTDMVLTTPPGNAGSSGTTVSNMTINNSTIVNGNCNKCSLDNTVLTNKFSNASVTGTTTNKLAKLTGAPSTVVISSAGDTGGVVGICDSACGTTGTAEITVQGTGVCVTDNSVTAGDYATISASVAGDCHSSGSTFPLGTQVVGRFLETGAAGTRIIMLFGAEFLTNTGGAGTTLLNTYANIAATACNGANSGQLGFTSNSIYTGRCNGSTWEWFWRGIPVTPPPPTGWTLDAGGGATTTANSDGTVTFFFPARSAVQMSAAYRAGAATQTITMLVCAVYGNVVASSTDATANPETTSDSLGLRDSGGKYSAYFWTSDISGFFASLDYWTSATVFSSSFNYPNTSEGGPPATQLGKTVVQDCHWLKVVEDVTNDSWQYNYTGSGDNWVEFISKPRTDFLASGTHDPAVVGYTNRVGMRITLVSWLAQ
jgi:hypothetical protein